MKRFLATMDHWSVTPINRGLVDIDDKGFVNGETPVEDFGMFIIQNEPFPNSEEQIFNMFLKLIEQQY